MKRRRKEEGRHIWLSRSQRRAWIPLYCSATDSGIQGEYAKWNWEFPIEVEVAPSDNSLSSFSRLSFSAEPKTPSRSERAKMRRSSRRRSLTTGPISFSSSWTDLFLFEDGSDKKENRSSRIRIGLSLLAEFPRKRIQEVVQHFTIP
jgi:hypothetical protein